MKAEPINPIRRTLPLKLGLGIAFGLCWIPFEDTIWETIYSRRPIHDALYGPAAFVLTVVPALLGITMARAYLRAGVCGKLPALFSPSVPCLIGITIGVIATTATSMIAFIPMMLAIASFAALLTNLFLSRSTRTHTIPHTP